MSRVAGYGIGGPRELGPWQPEHQKQQRSLADPLGGGIVDQPPDELGERENEGQIEEKLDRIRGKVLVGVRERDPDLAL